MARTSDDTDCYQFIDCIYKFKRLKSVKRRDVKEYYHHILGYHWKQNILLVEQVQESQQWGNLIKYNKKRYNCKTKHVSSEVKHQSYINKSYYHYCDTSYSVKLCTSIIAGIWHWPYLAPVTVITQKTICPDQDMTVGSLTPVSLSSQLEKVSTSFSLSSTLCFPISYDIFNSTASKMKSTFCDNPSDSFERNVNSKLNILPYKKKKPNPPKNQPRSSCYYLILMLFMIVKELAKHLSESLNRMRRKTQYLLPILIFIQLLIAAPLINCTTPLNQTVSASVLSSVSLDMGELSLVTTSTSAPSTTLSDDQKIPEQSTHQREGLATRTDGIAHRPSGGSSITSYISHEAKIRRDPNLSFTNSGCHSCQMRERVKADNLESIKRHILLRLEMQTLPNITTPPVPHTIIENFYKNHSHNENQKSSYTESSASGKKKFMYTTLSLSESNLFASNNDGVKKTDNYMQGDDPSILTDDNNQAEDDQDEKDEQLSRNNFDDEFFSVINSVYVFPTMPRMRHNRKTEVLNFKFKSSEHSTVSQALLHVYIRGRDWIREHEPDALEPKKSASEDHRKIIITVHRVIRRFNSTIATHTVNVTESQHKIPNGLGQWISIDVTQLVQGWVRNATTNQGIVIKAAESWMKPLIITGDLPNNKAYTIYIEMLTKDNRKRRTKRNTSMNCSESDNEERCCRYPLVVNFVEFEWTWVVAPTSFNAYFCNGECKLGFLEKYPHTHLMQLSTAPQPCCSPTKMSPLRLLYFNAENTLVMSTIPNMAVEKCSCS